MAKPWPELALAAVPVVTLPREVKMSLPEVLPQPPPKTAILPLFFQLSPGLRLPLPLQLPLRPPMRGFSNSS